MKLDLSSTAPITAFFKWWGAELSEFVPEWLSKMLGQTTEQIVVSKHADGMRLTLKTLKRQAELAEIPTDTDASSVIRSLHLKFPQLSDADVVLQLHPKQVLIREVSLPLAAKNNLHQVVNYELDRYTPFKAEQVYYDVLLTGKDAEKGQLTAQLALIPRQKLDELYEELSACGLHPLSAGVEITKGQPYQFNLLPAELRPKQNHTPKIIAGVLGGLLITLLLGLLLLPIWLNQQLISELETELKSVSKVANEVQSLKKSFQNQLQVTSFLLEKKRTKPVLIYVLNDLSKRIPSDTWLSYMQYKDGNLQIRGESAAASGLIETLEESPMFSNTRFVSPVTRNSASNTDRFQLSVDVLNGGVFDRKSR